MGWGELSKTTVEAERAVIRRLRELITPPMTTAERDEALALLDDLEGR